MAKNLLTMPLLFLISELKASIKAFKNSLDTVIEADEKVIIESRITGLMGNLTSRMPSAPAEARENIEISDLLEQLLKDKETLYRMRIHERKWLALVDAIEDRLENRKELLGKEELEAYDKILVLSNNLREILKKGE